MGRDKDAARELPAVFLINLAGGLGSQGGWIEARGDVSAVAEPTDVRAVGV